MKRLLAAILTFFMLFSLPVLGLESRADSGYPTRVIHVVYDDSGSMIKTGGNAVDTWCQAKYSMEVFAAMLGEGDTMNIYVMSDYVNDTAAGPRLSLNGGEGPAANVEKVHDMVTHASDTPFNAVRKAYSDLEGVSADEKWLVVLTDGEFQDVENIDSFFAQKQPDVSVMFLGMGAAAPSINADEANNIYFVKAETSKQILNKITDICTRIFNSNKLTVDTGSMEFSFDVPMSELVVFAQGADVRINGLKAEDGTEIKANAAPVPVRYCEEATTNPSYTDIKVDTELVGSILTFKGDYSAGAYTADVTGAETLEIYYKPNVSIAVYLTDGEGQLVESMDALEAGEYILSFGLVRSGTEEQVAESQLLGDVEYSAYVTVNGKEGEQSYASGDTIYLEEGSFQVDATARYLKYNTVTTQLSYEIYKNKNMELQVTDNPRYMLKGKGIANSQEPIVVKATLDGQEFTAEQWACVEELALTQPEEEERILFVTEKSEEPGIFHIYPTMEEGKRPSGEFSDLDLSVKAWGKSGLESWSGEASLTAKIDDQRSWFEKNLDKIIKITLLVLLGLLILGYVPPFKKYLPKKLKKMPNINCKPNIPGKRPWMAKGRYSKKRISTFIPYKAERGSIRFLPTGVAGAPPLQIKAAGGNRVEIVNTKAYGGNAGLTIDGLPIQKDVKKNLRKPAGMIIKYVTKETDYNCTPSN